MKKWMLLACTVVWLPLQMAAQDDDMYFVPTKENVDKATHDYGLPKHTYYSGSDRSVDEYNRMAASTVTAVDSAGNDIIDFSAVRGVYPDSAYAYEGDDYKYTRQMTRYEGYTPSEAYWEGYRDGQWASPWYYTSYHGWYDPWYDPWYYGRYGWVGYYRPASWYGYYGWYRPYYHYTWYSPRRHYGRGGYVNHALSPSLRYYDRRNYSGNGTRHPYGTGTRTGTRPGNIGSGVRSSSTYSGTRPSGGSYRSSGSVGSGSYTRSSGSYSHGGGMRPSGGAGGGGGRIGGGRR